MNVYIDLLPFNAQLNCRADKLSTSMHKNNIPTDINVVNEHTSVATPLIVCNNTITTKHIPSIRREVNQEPIIQLMQ